MKRNLKQRKQMLQVVIAVMSLVIIGMAISLFL